MKSLTKTDIILKYGLGVGTDNKSIINKRVNQTDTSVVVSGRKDLWRLFHIAIIIE